MRQKCWIISLVLQLTSATFSIFLFFFTHVNCSKWLMCLSRSLQVCVQHPCSRWVHHAPDFNCNMIPTVLWGYFPYIVVFFSGNHLAWFEIYQRMAFDNTNCKNILFLLVNLVMCEATVNRGTQINTKILWWDTVFGFFFSVSVAN